MRIAILSMYNGVVSRGVETWTRELASIWLKEGNNVIVFQTRKENSNYSQHIVDLKLDFSKELNRYYWNAQKVLFTLKCISKLISYKPDIVIPCNGGFQSLAIKIISKVYGCKYVCVGHAGIGRDDKWNILTRPDCFVSPSIRGSDWAKSLAYARGLKIVHIPHGVDLKKFNPNSKKIKLNLNRPIYLCVSSFDKFKRVNLAIKAIARLKEGSLLILGGDRNDGKIPKLANKLLGKSRYKIIKLPPDKMAIYYASSDVFTLASKSTEAFGLVYLEALASGLPVVATDDKLRREIVGKAGILIDPTSIDQYAEALKIAAKKNWGNLPRIQAEKFSWEKIAIQYENLFLELIK